MASIGHVGQEATWLPTYLAMLGPGLCGHVGSSLVVRLDLGLCSHFGSCPTQPCWNLAYVATLDPALVAMLDHALHSHVQSRPMQPCWIILTYATLACVAMLDPSLHSLYNGWGLGSAHDGWRDILEGPGGWY